MSQELVGLRIDLDESDAVKATTNLEKRTDKATNAMAKDYEKVQGSIDKTAQGGKKAGRSLLEAGKAGGKAASILGTGFSAVTAGISAASASAENFETAVVGVGASIASGFAAGGLVGGAVAALSAGIGFLTRDTDEWGEAAERAASKAATAFDAAASRTDAMQSGIEGLKFDIRKMQAEVDGVEFDEPFERAKDAIEGTHVALEANAKAIRQQESAAGPAIAKLKKIREEMEALKKAEAFTAVTPGGALISGRISQLEKQEAAAEKIVQAETSVLAILREEREETLKILGLSRERLGLMEQAKAASKGAEPGPDNAAVEAARVLATVDEQRAEAIQKQTDLLRIRGELQGAEKADASIILEIERARQEGRENTVHALEEQLDIIREQRKEQEAEREAEAKDRAEKAKALAEEQRAKAENERRADGNRRLREEIELLRAANDYERERIRIKQESQRLIEQGLDATLVQERAQEKLADLAEREAKAKERAADSAERATQATEDQARAARKLAKSTNPNDAFQNFGGTSTFGFGKGQVGQGGGSLFGAVRVRTRPFKGHSRPTKTAGSGATANSAGSSTKEIDIDAAVQAIEEAAANVDTTTQALNGIEQAITTRLVPTTVALADESTRADEAISNQVSTLEQAVTDMARRVSLIERNAQRAAGTGRA